MRDCTVDDVVHNYWLMQCNVYKATNTLSALHQGGHQERAFVALAAMVWSTECGSQVIELWLHETP